MEINQDINLNKDLFGKLDSIPTREGMGKAIVDIATNDENVFCVTADVAESVRVHYFAQKFPYRFIQCGVAEQNMAGVAAGLAYAGKTVFMAAYGVFNPGRNYDQIRVAICYANANVKVVASHTGLTVGPDGATHQALEDIGLMRGLPRMTVVYPSDSIQAYKATYAIYKKKGPCYLRLSREKMPVFTTVDTPFEIGKSNIMCFGEDVTIISTGPLVYEAIQAAQILENYGIRAEVIDCSTLSYDDFDKNTIIKSAKKTGKVVTVEEHQIVNGLGSAVAEVLSENYPTKVLRIGMNMQFGESGEGIELLKHYGLWRDKIADKIKKFVMGD
ncbi:MAG: transketolase family protein [Candidatus Micrarchaeota archaeon]|nr:transketolase family protein [Candidatus Micrarchaeota archaeon]